MRNIKYPNYKVKYPEKENATAFIPENERPFKYTLVGETYPLSSYYINRPKDSHIIDLEYVIDGKGEIYLDGKWKKAAAGDVFILCRGEIHEYRADPLDPWHKLWINCAADHLTPFMGAYGVASGIYHVPDIRRYFDRAMELSRTTEISPGICHELADCIHGIIIAIAANTMSSSQNDENRIREALNASIYKKADLTELAESLHISKSNMIRIFKKHYGTTPYEYLLNLKIESAKLLLVSTSMSVRQIADKLCIFDEHYFSTLFCRRVGIRPREYRNRHKQQ